MAQLLARRANQGRLRIATQGILQKECQLGISEWNMTAAICQGLNDKTKRGQTEVNFLGFL